MQGPPLPSAQNPGHQIGALLRAGVDRNDIHPDKASGAKPSPTSHTMDGLASARARGRVGGRRPELTADQAARIQELYDMLDKTVQQIADLSGVPRSTVYGQLKGDTVRRRRKKLPERA